MGQGLEEGHLARDRFEHLHVEAEDAQRVAHQLHVHHLKVEIHVRSEAAGVGGFDHFAAVLLEQRG